MTKSQHGPDAGGDTRLLPSDADDAATPSRRGASWRDPESLPHGNTASGYHADGDAAARGTPDASQQPGEPATSNQVGRGPLVRGMGPEPVRDRQALAAATGRQRGKARRRLLAGVAVLGIAGLVAWGIIGRERHVANLQQTSNEEGIPQVQVISPIKGPPTRTLDLPGSVNAWYSAPIYAQVTGYVRKWYKDFGAPVKAGELLATIDTPGLDQQLASAQADLGVAQTRANLAALTAKRYKALSGTQAVAQQDIDVQVANAAAAQSQVIAAQATLARYQALEAFKRVVAPFDGVVSARNTDVGNYVNGGGGDAGANSGEAALFTISDIHKMRVFVSVPQDYSGVLKSGLTASLTLSQFPGKLFKADFETSAQAFNPQSRTVVTELTVDNPDHLIWPGTYTDVHFVVASNPDVLIVPEQALLFRAQGMQVALVGPDNKVHLQDVKLGLNLGQNVQVIEGLKPDDRLINTPSAGEMDGQVVNIVTGVSGIAPAPEFKAKSARPKPMNTAQSLKVEGARDDTDD